MGIMGRHDRRTRATRVEGATVLRTARILVPLVAAGSGCGSADEEGTWSPEPIGQAAQAEVVCAAGEVLEGIDVSTYQGTVDWASVADAGIRFAVARINHGAVTDDQFAANWPAMKQHGIVRGAYQYFDPGGDPVEQATVVVDALGLLEPGDLPPVIDVESTDGQPPSVIAANVRTWVDLVEAGTGRRPIIYTGSYFWNDNVGTSEFADEGYPLWIAHYTTGCPNLPTAWSQWAMWQYTSTGSVAGISGNVDRDEFNGSELELQDFAANGYRAEVVTLTYPETLAVGETGTARLVVRNVGARTWDQATRLGTTEPRDRESPFAASSWLDVHRAAELTDPVAPGETAELEFGLQAPSAVDTYVEHFNLLVEGVAWFSDIDPGGGPLDDEIELRIQVTTSTGAGGSGTGGAAGEGGASVEGGIPASGDDGGCSLAPPRRGTSHSLWLAVLLAAAASWSSRRGRCTSLRSRWRSAAGAVGGEERRAASPADTTYYRQSLRPPPLMRCLMMPASLVRCSCSSCGASASTKTTAPSR
jgi:lysozyme